MVKLADLASRIRVSPLIREPCQHSSRCILCLCCCFDAAGGYCTFRIHAIINAGLNSSLGLEASTRFGAPGALTLQTALKRTRAQRLATDTLCGVTLQRLLLNQPVLDRQ